MLNPNWRELLEPELTEATRAIVADLNHIDADLVSRYTGSANAAAGKAAIVTAYERAGLCFEEPDLSMCAREVIAGRQTVFTDGGVYPRPLSSRRAMLRYPACQSFFERLSERGLGTKTASDLGCNGRPEKV